MKKKYLKPSFKTFEVEKIKLLEGTTTGSGTGSQELGGGGSL